MVQGLSENSDDLYGKIAVRGVDVIIRQLQVAHQQALALQAELDKVDINISDVDFKDTADPTIAVTEEEPEAIELVPDLTVDEDEPELNADKSETLFKQEEMGVDVKTLIDPVTKEPFAPRTLKQEDIDEDFDPSRPELGSIIGMTEQLREHIRQYYYDSSNRYEIVFYVTPDEFLNLAAPMSGDAYDKEVIDKLQESIFPEESVDNFDFDPLQLRYNMDKQQITGHEGRHRSFAILQEQQKRGGDPIKIPVRVTFQVSRYDPSWDATVNMPQRPVDVPIVPLELDDIKQQSNQSERVDEITGPAPRITPTTTFEEFAEKQKEFDKETAKARDIVEEERFMTELKRKKKLDDTRETIGKVFDEVYGEIVHKIDKLSTLPRDIDYDPTLLDVTYIPLDTKVLDDENTVEIGDFYEYNIEDKELTIKKEMADLIKPENMKRLMEAAMGDDLPFTIVTPDDDIEDIERDEEYNLNVDEEDELVDEVVSMFNSVVDEANSSDDEYGGSIETRIKRLKLQMEIQRILEDEE